MNFKFKVQQYQTDAVDAVVNVFNGQGKYDNIRYKRDLGVAANANFQQELVSEHNYDEDIDTGFKNEIVELSDEQLLENIRQQQRKFNIKESDKLVKKDGLGRCLLDIEMETGTGKTYVYIKTIFELNKRYGWSKFIVVVPSIAIREGVKKSFEITQEHFMDSYGKKARFFVYDSKNLTQLDSFSSDSGINVMIINMQAFNTSLKEGGRSKESRKIYSELDAFASRRPIDVIKANRPIIILDEPQKMGGDATQNALKNFNPLFCLHYSATHKEQHNLVYVLDALDAYNQKLVKRIEVKGFELLNLRGAEGYLYLNKIVLSNNKPPCASIELEVLHKSGIKREIKVLGVNDNLFYAANELEAYKNGYIISDIDPYHDSVAFTNGTVIKCGEIIGDVTEADKRRIQIRETIASHFDKEEELYAKGIKTLSLFFIDEVAKYRQYDEDGDAELGEYGKIFEQEYLLEFNRRIGVLDTPYQKYLKEHCSDINLVHNGYFSVDKKGYATNSTVKRGDNISDDITAYDLILKNKERLLSFDEPTRFIFSHSALREGWDNPNIFQICTLKHSDNELSKRQEVGRGLRLCVDKNGDRMDVEACGSNIHQINKLTVIASESYQKFVDGLQKEITDVKYERPAKIEVAYFAGKSVMIDGKKTKITEQQANIIYQYLSKNDYIGYDGKVTDAYKDACDQNSFAEMPDAIKDFSADIHNLIQAVYKGTTIEIDNGHATKILRNDLNKNFEKSEFQELWQRINHKYAYTVQFDSAELIAKAVKYIDENLVVGKLQYIVTSGEQNARMRSDELEQGDAFTKQKTKTKDLISTYKSSVKYDLVGKVAAATSLTRKTVAEILKNIAVAKLYMFRYNPEEFIAKVSKLINEQKATMIIEHVTYNLLDECYENDIFTAELAQRDLIKAYKAEKNVQDYIFTDSNVERNFAKDLDSAEEVCVYAKLPRGFAIPTPVGNYAPDWAIAFKKGTVKHVFFVAETKGSMDSMNLKPIEKAKISCASKLFNELSTENVKYHEVASYKDLLNVMNTL